MTSEPQGPAPSSLDWRAKGLPALERSMDPATVAGSGWNLFDGHMLMPTMVIRRDALEHDIEVMARYAQERGVSLAPHGKTTMSPAIWRQQLAAGAWAITVATPWQARVAATVGVPRILIANEVVDEAGLTWLGSVLDGDGPEIICQADSVAGVERMATILGVRRLRLRVLVEVGPQGGRAGVRSLAAATAVAAAVDGASPLELAGVTSFEGVVTGGSAAERTVAVGVLLDTVREVGDVVAGLVAENGAGELILSGGGSEHFITVTEALSRPLPGDVAIRVVIRSGCTVTHDHGGYDLISPFGSNGDPGSPRLIAAIEVWAPVLSRPEPKLAIVGAGRRDLPYDAGLPRPIKVRRIDESDVSSIEGAQVTRLDDQHAFVNLGSPSDLAVGDLVGFGIAHPCSAFDRWRFIPVVDDRYRIVDVYETVF